MEQIIIDHYVTERLPDGFVDTIGEQAQETVALDRSDLQTLRKRATKRLRELDEQEERLLDLGADGSIHSVKLRERIQKIAVERVRLNEDRQSSTEELTQALDTISAVLHFLEDPQAMYKAGGNTTRRRMNGAFYTAPYLTREIGRTCRTNARVRGIHRVIRAISPLAGRTDAGGIRIQKCKQASQSEDWDA
ncbi:hypothetical protein GCM10009554_38900 [Kribbella koreensis]|uniref:Uncharacterized protein n=1 Tax=Kribbella koreensis TaxID=57909 RepID=A0ABN1QMD3_9ACTN